jgi:hypothetical protein
VYALREALLRNTTFAFNFRCLTEHQLPHISTVEPLHPWPKWWPKLQLFELADGPSMFFDLDVIITGNLDYLTEYTSERLAAPANWGQSGHGGVQSSVMVWDGKWRSPYRAFHPARDMQRLWGDQEYLTELVGDEYTKLPGIGSYKYHVRPKGSVPGWMAVCCCHGEPKPADIGDICLSKYTSTLNSRIRLGMAQYLRPGSGA